MFTSGQNFVAQALTLGALQLIPEGRRLKSGRESPYFFDSAKFLSGKALSELAAAYANLNAMVDYYGTGTLYGPPYKGTILAPAVSMAIWEKCQIEIGWSSSRKEPKAHGEGGILLGTPLKGASVIIVDDVITTGGTKSEALELVRSEGGTVESIVIAFDRMETAPNSRFSAAQLFTDEYGVPVYAAANLDDLIAVLKEDTDFPNNTPEMLEKILEYKDHYGVKT